MIVESADRRLNLETIDLSPGGVKVRLDEPTFELGMPVHLLFDPPEGGPLELDAIVWRRDPDGAAFFFIEGDEVSFPLEPTPPVDRWV